MSLCIELDFKQASRSRFKNFGLVPGDQKSLVTTSGDG